jgi:hypothetical protein
MPRRTVDGFALDFRAENRAVRNAHHGPLSLFRDYLASVLAVKGSLRRARIARP